MKGIPMPRRKEKPHRFLSREDLAKVYQACRTDRERLIIRLLLHGLRAGQLLALTWADLKGDALLIAPQKRNHTHAVALDAETVRLMTQVRADDSITCVIPLSYDRLRDIIVAISKRSRVRFTAHTLRHTFASQALVAGMDSTAVQHAGGWNSPTMMQFYGRSIIQEAAVSRMREMGLVSRLLDDP